MFSAKFDITSGAGLIGDFKVNGNQISIKYKLGGTATYFIKDIKSLELVQSQEVNAGSAATGGVVGALLLGPLGAVAGASLGRLLRECTFIVGFSDGKTIACKAIYKLYDNFQAHLKISGIKLD